MARRSVVSAKRYRYLGKERDEETGLCAHGLRSYLPWLGRWDRPDPSGLRDGPNRYQYARGRVIAWSDPNGAVTTSDLLRGR